MAFALVILHVLDRCVLVQTHPGVFNEMLGLYNELGVGVGVVDCGIGVSTQEEYDFIIQTIGGRVHPLSRSQAIIDDLHAITVFWKARLRWQGGGGGQVHSSHHRPPSYKRPDLLYVLYNGILNSSVVSRSIRVPIYCPEFSVVAALKDDATIYEFFHKKSWECKQQLYRKVSAYGVLFQAD